jgi:hypothetical protein
VAFIAPTTNLKRSRSKRVHGRSGGVREVWYGELLRMRGRRLTTRYAERRTMTQDLAVRPTVSSTVRRNSLAAKKKRKTEMWSRKGMASTIFRIWKFVMPLKRYVRTRPRCWGEPLSWEYCRYSRAHCWTSVDTSAQVKLRKRLRNMRILMRIAIPEGLKATRAPAGDATGDVPEVPLFD